MSTKALTSKEVFLELKKLFDIPDEVINMKITLAVEQIATVEYTCYVSYPNNKVATAIKKFKLVDIDEH